MVRVHVYDLGRLSREWLYDGPLASSRRQFEMERLFTERLRSGTPGSDLVPPEQAELYYVSACLLQGFFELRAQPGALQTWSDQIEAALRAAGPWWDRRRDRHIVWSLRCADRSSRFRTFWVRAGGWPSIWDSGAALLCIENADERTRGQGYLMPYIVSPSAACAPAERSRPSLLFFSGSRNLGNRRTWLDAMEHSCAEECVVHTRSRGANATSSADDVAALRGYAHARFALCPRGDTSSRKAMYDAMACGAIPFVVNDFQTLPLADSLDWSGFALRAAETAQPSEAIRALAAVPARKLRQMRARLAVAVAALDYREGGRIVDLTLDEIVRAATAAEVPLPRPAAQLSAAAHHPSAAHHSLAHPQGRAAAHHPLAYPLAEPPPSSAAVWRAGLHSCTTRYCAAWARGCGDGISRADEIALSRLLEAIDCSHLRVHLDCPRARALLAARLPPINSKGARDANATAKAAAVAIAATSDALGGRTRLCLSVARAFEIVYRPALGGGDDDGGAGLGSVARQALLAAEAGRRLLLPSIRTTWEGSPPGWCFEPPPPRHELRGACASSSLERRAGTACERVATRLLRGRRWLCATRVGPQGPHHARSCDAVARAWLDAAVATQRTSPPAAASPPAVAVSLCVGTSGTNLSAATRGRSALLPRTRSGVKAAARAWAHTPPEAAPIPRIVHQTWPTCVQPRRRAAWRERCAQQLGGGWRLWLWSDADNERLVAAAFPWLLPLYRSYDNEIKRVDAVRYLYLYLFGGVYLDTDSTCLRSLDSLPLAPGEAIFGTQHSRCATPDAWPDCVANAFMAAPPRHPLLALAINRLQFSSRRGTAVLHTAGPGFLTRVLQAWGPGWGFGNVTIHMPMTLRDGGALRPSILYPSEWNATTNACGQGSTAELDACAARLPRAAVATFWTHSWKA